METGMWSEVLNLFREYTGTGLIVLWFLIAEIYLFLKETKKPVRIIFIYVPVILLLFFFNPLFVELVYQAVGQETYYRILWLLPMTVVIAFSVVHLYGQLQGKKRIVFAVTAAVCVMVSGGFIYINPHFHKAENLYHVPQNVVDICDAIEVEGREVMAVFPAELVQYVRQYSPVVCMPYGREVLISGWGYRHELYFLMEAEEIDVEALVQCCREKQCVYIILPQDKKQNGSFEEYEYELFAEIDKYVIYKDSTVNLTAFMEQ